MTGLSKILITTPTSAVTEGESKRVIRVPDDSIIYVAMPLKAQQGLVQVIFNGKTVFMFAEDIRERGKRLAGRAFTWDK